MNRFNNAVTALVKGFFEGTLAKGTCSACAVGNIVAHSISVKPYIQSSRLELAEYYKYENTHWVLLIGGCGFGGLSQIKARANILATGYNVEQLTDIEDAFEWATKYQFYKYSELPQSEIMQDQFNGLMAVVDVLMEIEGMNKAETDYRKYFEYTEDFKPVNELILT